MEGFNQKLNEFKVPLGLFLLGGVLLIGGLFSSNLITSKDDPGISPKTSDSFKESMVSEADLAGVKIDVAGAVNNPGVFTLGKESRIEDAIRMAGGFNPNVDKEYVASKLNLAQKVSDGLKIYIPFEGDPTSQGFAGQVPQVAGVSASSGKIGVNSADQAALETLPGVGPATAKKIIENRPYGSIEELISKKAVSKSVYSKISVMVDLN